MAGFFITFEGGEGTGKTTQINRLAQHLTQAGHKVLTTREPGGTPEGEKIRDLLVQRDGGNWTPMSEILLFYAARDMLVNNVIKPALNEDKIVICDRFFDSTIAYQGYGHDFDKDAIKTLNTAVLGDFKPDLTFVLDIDPEIGLKRSDRRLAAEALSIKQKEDRFENLNIEFHTRLRDGFLEIAKQNPNRCLVVDAEQPIDAVTTAIIDATTKAIESK